MAPRGRFFKSNLRQAIAAHQRIGVTALKASAIVVQNQAKRNARGGFTSGAFTTTGWNLITHMVIQGRQPRAEVGSRRRHFLYWELGHFNVFTRKWERQQWLAPAFQTTRKEQEEAADKAVRSMMSRGGPVGSIATAFMARQ